MLIYIYLVATTATATAACLLIWIWREGIGHLFSSDDEVAEIVSTTIPILCSKTWADGTDGVTSGTFSAVGRQSWMFWTSLVEYCFIGLPLAFYFAFQMSIGVNGLWLANSILANCYAITCLLLLFCRIDWNRECQHTKRRMPTLDFADDLSEPLLSSARYTEDAAESDLSSEPVLTGQLNDTAEDDLSREGNLDRENNKFSNDNDGAANGPHNEISSPV